MIILLLLFILIAAIIDLLISAFTVKKIFNSVEKLPHSQAGLVPGTRSRLSNGKVNLYYKYRLDAAEKVYNSGKVDFLLVSGYSDGNEYNEPDEMKADLIARGIPEKNIVKDPEGFRTIDSVIRARGVFGYSSIIVTSQKFHNQRALFIASEMRIDAVGFNAENVPFFRGFKTRFREIFARLRMIFDLLIKKPPEN